MQALTPLVTVPLYSGSGSLVEESAYECYCCLNRLERWGLTRVCFGWQCCWFSSHKCLQYLGSHQQNRVCAETAYWEAAASL